MRIESTVGGREGDKGSNWDGGKGGRERGVGGRGFGVRGGGFGSTQGYCNRKCFTY